MPQGVEVVRLIIICLLFIVLSIASVSDIRDRRIPNWTIGAVAILFAPWAIWGGQVSVLSSIEAAVVSLILSGAMYAFRLIGAGDSKLLTVSALFVGLDHLLQFFMLVALAGGAIALASLALRPRLALVLFQMRGKADAGRGVPYGVAIALAAICVVMWPHSQNAISDPSSLGGVR